LAEALRIVRPDVVGRLAGELNGLPSIDPRANCDELLGGRSELIIFQSPDRKQTKVLIVTAACIPVTNGRIVRAALGAGYRAGEIHWIDEALLLDLPRTP